jgi:hypothetical protein|tara:strand:+ start:1861 stop:2127 length:267 start_codon:yes stop_codon:yes gene_type:complete
MLRSYRIEAGSGFLFVTENYVSLAAERVLAADAARNLFDLLAGIEIGSHIGGEGFAHFVRRLGGNSVFLFAHGFSWFDTRPRKAAADY